MARDAEAEEVEEADRAHDRKPAPEHRGRADHLVPAAAHVEEARVRTVRVPGRNHEEHEREQQPDGRGAERALEPDRDERRDLVPA
jgi:hypothetical protein